MATNPYFSYQVKSEQDLYEDIIIESLKFYGQDVYYIPRESMGYDKVWSDDIINKYDDTYKLEMYIENTEGFDGEGDLFTKFGIEIRDAATFVVARRRWKTEIASKRQSDEDPNWYRPREGDLIYLPMSASMFQIMRVETEDPFFQISNLPVFKMSCELYEYSNEDFDTGIDAIDRVETAFSYQYLANMDSDAYGYEVGETVTQLLGSGATMSGEVVGWFDSSDELFIAHAGADDGKYHEFITAAPIVGQQSGASFIPLSINEEPNELHQSSQNIDFADEVSDFLDFSESNPFGDPNV